ncbi:MAG: DUF4340 domain-containing protein [bacterium]|nr:DUF4340 domain-containing protein [bacterium]
MKRFKRIYILLGVFAVICLATLGVMQIEESREKIKNTEEIILAVPSDSVSSLSWEYGEASFAFHKDEKWLYDEDEAFPVKEAAVERILGQFQELGAAFVIEEVEDYGQYGLEEPTCTVHLAAEGQSYDIQLGSYSTMDSQRYVSIGDGNVYLVKNDPLDYFEVGLDDMIDHDKIPSIGEAMEVRFTGAENYSIAYEEDSADTYCSSDVYFTERDGKNLPLDTSRVKSYLQSIGNLSLTNYVTYNVTEEELAEYGLDAPELTVNAVYISEDENGEEYSDTFTLYISRSAEVKAAEEQAKESRTEGGGTEDGQDAAASQEGTEASVEEADAYVRVGESQIVYQITSASYEKLMAVSYDSLRHKEVFTGDTTAIRQMDITLEDTVYTITSQDDEEGERTYYYREQEVEMASLKSHLKNMDAADFTDEQPAQKEEIHLVVHQDNENFSQVEIGLYRYDGSLCLATVDGEPFAFVQRSDVVDLIEAVHGIVLNE